jgi:CheY-like chemotaxis protein
MDHMMPKMDGIETTQRLRAMGYKGAIVALTANAIVGTEEMFTQNGFDGFISKPIDIGLLNAVLKKFVREKHLEEAKKYTQESLEAEQEQTATVDPKLFRVFCLDAEKAIPVLHDTAANGDIKLFTTTVHAMKSALANIGEQGASKLASALETAGQNVDTAFISKNTENLISALEALIQNLGPTETEDHADVLEDTVFLAEQLQIVKAACENYDDTAAYAALDRLREKPWKRSTVGELDKIRDMLFLQSDFESAEEHSRLILNTYNE